MIQDVAVHRDVLREIGDWAAADGWVIRGVAASPIRGAEGNREFFYHLARTGSSIDREPAIEAALRDPAQRVAE